MQACFEAQLLTTAVSYKGTGWGSYLVLLTSPLCTLIPKCSGWEKCAP